MSGTQSLDRDDAVGTIQAIPWMWRWLVEDVLGRQDGLLSLGHVHGAGSGIEDLRRTLATLLGIAEADLAPAAPGTLVARVGEAAKGLNPALVRGDIDDETVTLLAATLEDLMQRAGRRLQHTPVAVPTQTGRIDQVNASDGGVPKTAVAQADVGPRGLAGDRQGNRRHHGKPSQALCLWSTEVLQRWQDDGHPIAAGCVGENLTVNGIDWTTLRPGVAMRLGEGADAVEIMLSGWAIPCDHQAQWFTDGDISRLDHDVTPGAARAYAWVTRPGRVRTGDTVVVEPPTGR